MSGIQPSEKIIGYIDILGFKSLVRAAEEGRGLSLTELTEAVKMLGTEKDRKRFERPSICPQSPRTRSDLDFQLTRASDCVIVSAEVSPAGVISLVWHCWGACISLLRKGLMCRGYVKLGPILHTTEFQIGSGLSDAVERERRVSIFKRDADERGTPFIEVDPEVADYVKVQPDECVKKLFARMVETDAGLIALFPFKRLNHSFIVAGPGIRFNPDKERASLNVMRDWIRRMKEQVLRHVDGSDESAVRKGEQYIRMLDAQLVACDKTEDAINRFAPIFGQ